MEICGSGDEVWQFTTEKDAGAWGVEVVTAPDAEKGGFISLCSFETTMNGLRKTYQEVRDTKVDVKEIGSVDEMYRLAEEGKSKVGRSGFWDWHTYVFHANCVTEVWNMKDMQNARYANVKAQTLVDFLKDYPEV
jgi:hypothetical protein